MDTKLVNVDQLTLDEALKIEGDWAQFSDSDLASLSTSLNATAIRDGLENGELALMVDSPSSPLLIRADGNQYFVNKTHAPTLAPNGISRIERRFSGHHGGGGVSPNGSLYPPKPMPPYTPEPVIRNSKDLSPTLEYCFEIAQKKVLPKI